MQTHRAEAEWIRRAQQGDDRAFAALIQPYMDRMYRLALRTLDQKQHEAEDAVQEALIKAWRALPRFRGESSISTWLYRIVWRTSIDRARTQASSQRVQRALEPSEVSAASGPSEEFELRYEVERSLQRLPLAYRAVVTLFYLEDLSLKEISEVLELPLGTVKTHLHRARKALRTELAGLLDEEGGR